MFNTTTNLELGSCYNETDTNGAKLLLQLRLEWEVGVTLQQVAIGLTVIHNNPT